MGSTKQVQGPIAGTFRQSGRMTCEHRAKGLQNQTSRTVLDDSGSLAITAWTCPKCGGVIEEISILGQDGKAKTRPVRYAVAPMNLGRGAERFVYRAPIN